jgi:hypothetical protein
MAPEMTTQKALTTSANRAVSKPQTHALRRVWNAGHFWAGRIAIGLAIANVYVGLHQLNESAKVYWWGDTRLLPISALSIPSLDSACREDVLRIPNLAREDHGYTPAALLLPCRAVQ